MLPVALILGLDQSNILRPYVIYIVGEQRYSNIQPYVIVFILLSIIDIAVQGSYLIRKEYREDSRFFCINIIFDVFLILGYLALLYYVIPEQSVFYSAIILTIAYAVEFSLQWFAAPLLMPRTYGDEAGDEDSSSSGLIGS